MKSLILLLAIFAVAYAQIENPSETPEHTKGHGNGKCSRHYICPPQFLRLSQNCYYFSKEKTPWQQAYFECSDLHGTLATIRNSNQDKMLRNFLNKIALVAVDRWIGGMYDWEQMLWKWGASGQEIKYQGFPRSESQDKNRLKWQCVVLDPDIGYKWNHRSCLEAKHYICQAKLKKVNKKDRKKLQRQYEATNDNRLNEVEVPELPYNATQNLRSWKDHVPNGVNHKFANDYNDIVGPAALARRNDTVVEKRRNKRKKKSKKTKPCVNYIVLNGTRYEIPQPKFGKRKRRNKSKEPRASMENLQTQIYYSDVPQSPLLPRVLTEELSFS